MQFIATGPDIPDALLQAHEEGRVVFFCGAGISYPAGLPDFQGLVDEIYRRVGTLPSETEQQAYGRGHYDAVLDLLERRLPGQRAPVRKALAAALQPNLRRKGASGTHTALLQLARSRDGAVRLVTTNFDRIFEHLTVRAKPAVMAYPAPMLPIPKNSRWNGLVYLHGLLPKKPEASALNRLVLTSGDFGLAYLTERWAARFVSELFRNYVVCFVGYSINDPVLRYMMDALAADRMLGEITPQAYALGDCTPGQESSKTIEWEAKGVTPILYEVAANTFDHSAMHQTLKTWAEIYRNGILGKERIVLDHAMARPSGSTKQDDFVGRMLWALSDRSGLPAKRFADFEPVPPLDWLEAFCEDRFRHCDLARYGVPTRAEVDDKLSFSLARRPSPYTSAPWMVLTSGGAQDSQWDDIMFHLARWLIRHLDDPALILWLADRGGRLHEQLIWLIEKKLSTFARLENEGNAEELARIRSQASNAVPRPHLLILWRLLITGRVKSTYRELELYRWKDRFQRDGLTATLRFELREILAPRVKLKRPFPWLDGKSVKDGQEHLKQIVNFELVLAGDNVRSSLGDLVYTEPWRNSMPALLDDFQQLLRDAMDLLHELGEGNDRNGRSHWDLPSISRHGQNRDFHDWVEIIELLRDAWLVVREIDPSRATRTAITWFGMPYPIFKRLALFAASHDDCIPPDQWVDWLVSDNAAWMWATEMKRETLRLFVLQGLHLTPQALGRLEAAILAGPSLRIYRDDIEPDQLQIRMDHSVWLYLAKLKSSGAGLGQAAAERLESLSATTTEWRLTDNERDEFSRWTSGTIDPEFNGYRESERAPRKRDELVLWLKRTPRSSNSFPEDNWLETCSDRFFHCAFALRDLAVEGEWPSERWREALQAWSCAERVTRSWRFVAPIIQKMPDVVSRDILDSFASWLEGASNSLDGHEDVFLELCQRILEFPDQDVVSNDEPVLRAINHPIGHVTQAMLNFWFARQPNDDQGLPAALEPLFTRLCDTGVAQYRHGRVILASRVIALFRVDRTWTDSHLLPLFDWTTDAAEARAVWEGFLWSPRLHRPLMITFKRQFLDTAKHYSELGEHAQQFAAFLTYAALESVDTYTTRDFQSAFGALPPEGLRESAQALIQALESAGVKSEDYWVNRIQPFWHAIWPKTRDLASKGIAETLAVLSIAARGKFPLALTAVLDWLQPIDHPFSVIHTLNESGLAGQFPEDALKLLDSVINDQPWTTKELGQCLTEIGQAAPTLLQDYRYQRLERYFQRRGTGL